MAFIREHQRIVGQIFKQCGRRLAGLASCQIARIILNSRAASGGFQHFNVEQGALFQTLGFEQPPCRFKLFKPQFQFVLNMQHGLFQRRPRGHVMRIGINPHALKVAGFLPRQRVKFGERVNFIAEQFNAPGPILIMGGEQVDRVAAHAEITPRKAHIIAPILQGNEIGQQLRATNFQPLGQFERHAGIAFDRANAVNARYRRHDYHIVAFQQCACCRVAHAVNLLVYIAFFFDIGVGARHIGFGLVIIVIRNEILDRIFRKEGFELAIKLRRQRFVRGKNKRRTLGAVDDLRHGEGLARTGDAKQHLVTLTSFNA